MFNCRFPGMKKDEIIRATDKILNSIPKCKDNIKNCKELLRIQEDEAVRSKLEKSRNSLKYIINTAKKLPLEQQKLIGYTYFEARKRKDICALLGFKYDICNKKLDRCKLDLGRIIFGMEAEFWDYINNGVLAPGSDLKDWE